MSHTRVNNQVTVSEVLQQNGYTKPSVIIIIFQKFFLKLVLALSLFYFLHYPIWIGGDMKPLYPCIYIVLLYKPHPQCHLNNQVGSQYHDFQVHNNGYIWIYFDPFSARSLPFVYQSCISVKFTGSMGRSNHDSLFSG